MTEETEPSLARWRRWWLDHQRGVVLGGLAVLLLTVLLLAQATPSISGREGSQDVRRDVVSLREYIDIRFTALDAKVEAQAAASKEAIEKALSSLNERIANTNEWRAQSKDRESTFATREQVDARAVIVDQRLNSIDNQLSSLNGSIKILLGVWAVVQVAVVAWLRRASDPAPRPRSGP